MTSIDIYSILSSKPHNPHYLTRYWKFIRSLSHQQKIKDVTEYHHICPKSKDLFPEYSKLKDHPWNGIHLTRKQHWVSHWMLAKAYGMSQSIAFKRMTEKSNNRITSTVYDNFRKEVSLIVSASNSRPNLGVSKAKSNKVHCYDSVGNYLILSMEEFYSRDDVYGINKYMDRSYMNSAEYRQALSESSKDRIWVLNPKSNERKFIKPIELDAYLNMGFIIKYESYDRSKHLKTCPHCNKTVDASNYSRWHGNNCKSYIIT